MCGIALVESIFDWRYTLAAIFEAELTFKGPSNSVPFHCFLSARLTPFFLECTIYFDLRSNVIVYEPIT